MGCREREREREKRDKGHRSSPAKLWWWRDNPPLLGEAILAIFSNSGMSRAVVVGSEQPRRVYVCVYVYVYVYVCVRHMTTASALPRVKIVCLVSTSLWVLSSCDKSS